MKKKKILKNAIFPGDNAHPRLKDGDLLDSDASTPAEEDSNLNDHDNDHDNGHKCPHATKAVSIAGLKKKLKVSWARIGACAECAKEKVTAKEALLTAAASAQKPIWICLKCGVQACEDHVKAHYAIPRSDLHSIYLNVMEWSLYCHKCEASMAVDSYKRVREAVDYVKKVEQTKGRAGGPTPAR